ncbi:MAG: hypothetical protein U0893_06580 [Chloroflexota bacterium]
MSSAATLTVIRGPRPNVQVQAVKLGPGQVQATLSAGQGTLSGTLQLGLPGTPARPIVNAHVDVQGGPQNITTITSVPINANPMVLTITRVNPGAVTVPLSIADGCGSWSSFVGFGTGV